MKKKSFDQLDELGKNYSSNIFEYEDKCIEDSDKADTSIQFLLIQNVWIERDMQKLCPYLGWIMVDVILVWSSHS